MSASFASGIYALVAEEFDTRERRDLTTRLQEILEAFDCARAAMAFESELTLLSSMIYYTLNLRSCSGIYS
jgi:hypothetical protein